MSLKTILKFSDGIATPSVMLGATSLPSRVPHRISLDIHGDMRDITEKRIFKFINLSKKQGFLMVKVPSTNYLAF